MDDRKISYFNTLIFTIITAVASLMVLGLLFLPIGKQFIYFIVAYEVGVFLIIAYCIFKILRGDKKFDENRKNFVVRFDECPDFYTKTMHADNTLWCHNDYKVIDPRTQEELVYRIFPMRYKDQPTSVPTTITLADNIPGQPYARFQLKQLESDDDYPTYDKKCQVLFKNPSSSNESYNTFQDLPWTYAKSRCESLGK